MFGEVSESMRIECLSMAIVAALCNMLDLCRLWVLSQEKNLRSKLVLNLLSTGRS